MPRTRTARRALPLVKGTASAFAAPMLVTVLASNAAEARCGSRGGPGDRKADGKCASHRD